jgi:hypothetical protein
VILQGLGTRVASCDVSSQRAPIGCLQFQLLFTSFLDRVLPGVREGSSSSVS